MFNHVDTSWPFGVLEYQHVDRVQYFECFCHFDSLLNPLAFLQFLQYNKGVLCTCLGSKGQTT